MYAAMNECIFCLRVWVLLCSFVEIHAVRRWDDGMCRIGNKGENNLRSENGHDNKVDEGPQHQNSERPYPEVHPAHIRCSPFVEVRAKLDK